MNHGGTEQVVLSIANSLDYTKYDVYVLSLYQDKDQLIPYFNNEVHVIVLGFNSNYPKLWNYIRIFRSFYRWLKRINPDIIHAHNSSGTYLYLAFIERMLRLNVRNIRTIHFSGFFLLRDTIINEIRYWVDRLATEILNPIVVGVSPIVLDVIKDKYPRQIFICINNGVDVDEKFNKVRYKYNKSSLLGVPEDSCVVTYVARVVFGKNHETLIRAWQYIYEKYEKVYLLLIGDGELLPLIQSEIKQMHMENRVICLGARSDVAEILSISDIGVFPSISEGLSLVLLEKMSMGLPIVMSRIPSFEYVIEDGYNGIFCDPMNESDIIIKMGKLLDNASLREILGNNARNTACEKFSIHSMQSQYMKLYEKLRVYNKSNSYI